MSSQKSRVPSSEFIRKKLEGEKLTEKEINHIVNDIFTEKEITCLLKKVGFSSWYRVAMKTNYYNIRKIFSPLYYDYKHPLSKLFYGDGGVLNFVVTK